MKLIAQLLFLFFINFTFSQDYRQAKIIFNDSTSIIGFGEIKNNKIYFKVKEEDEPGKWSYDIAKGLTFFGYGFSEKYEYIQSEKNVKPIIVEVVEEGNVTLYKDSNLFHITSEDASRAKRPLNATTMEIMSVTFYVKRKNEEFATDISFSFKIRAKKYFSDCKEIIAKIDNKKFTKKNISDMVFYYNEYCGEDNE